MDTLRDIVGRWPVAARFLSKYWFMIFTVLFYILFTAASMGRGFTHCTDSIYGFGDSTAGPVWRNSLHPTQPLLGGYESSTNYPQGESLYSPVNFSGVSQTATLAAVAKVVGPVCSFNLSNIMGYLTTALVMFGFIYYLLKSRWIAFMAGYAVAFTPYVQAKIGGHPSYAYGSLLIALLWLLLHVLRRKKTAWAIFLGLVLGICAYFDPYFVLLAATIVLPVTCVWAVGLYVHSRQNREATRKEIRAAAKPLLVAFLVFLTILSPLIVVRIKDASTINASVSGVRGNVFAAAMQCSNAPLDYLLPDPNNVTMLALFGPSYTAKNISHRTWCGYGESRVSISLTILAVISLGVVIVLWERMNGRRTKLHQMLNYNPKVLIWSVGLVALTAFLIGLPPHLHGYKMPSDLILKFTQTWRIFAREYLVLNIAVVTLFAVALKYFSSTRPAREHRRLVGVIFVGLFILIIGEYHINPFFNPPVFSYSRDVPHVYQDVKSNKNINAIAEYPLDRSGVEYDSIVYYLTMEAVHKKPIFNSAAITDSKENIHIAMKDLTDPQTLPALRAFGIQYVVIHGVPAKDILAQTNQLQVIEDDVQATNFFASLRATGTNDVVLAKIVNGPKATDALTFKKGFAINLNIMVSPLASEYEALQNTELQMVPLSGKASASLQDVCFDAKMAGSNDTGKLTVSVDGVPKVTQALSGSYTHVTLQAKDGATILLHNSNGHNMRLNNLGCRAE